MNYNLDFRILGGSLITPRAKPEKGNTMFSNLADAEINLMGVTPTTIEIRNTIDRIRNIAVSTGASDSIVTKKISELVKSYEAASFRETEIKDYKKSIQIVDDLGQDLRLLKDPAEYFGAKIQAYLDLRERLGNKYTRAEEEGDIDSQAQILSNLDDLETKIIQAQIAGGNIGRTPDAAVMITDFDPYSGKVYSAHYVTYEDYQRNYKNSYPLVEGEQTQFGTLFAVNPQNIRGKSFMLGGTRFDLKERGKEELGISPEAIGKAARGEPLTPEETSSLLGRIMIGGKEYYWKRSGGVEGQKYPPIPIDFLSDLIEGQIGVGLNNSSIYVKRAGKVKKILVDDAEGYIRKANKDFVKPLTNKMEELWNYEVDEILDRRDVPFSPYLLMEGRVAPPVKITPSPLEKYLRPEVRERARGGLGKFLELKGKERLGETTKEIFKGKFKV